MPHCENAQAPLHLPCIQFPCAAAVLLPLLHCCRFCRRCLLRWRLPVLLCHRGAQQVSYTAPESDECTILIARTPKYGTPIRFPQLKLYKLEGPTKPLKGIHRFCTKLRAMEICSSGAPEIRYSILSQSAELPKGASVE